MTLGGILRPAKSTARVLFTVGGPVWHPLIMKSTDAKPIDNVSPQYYSSVYTEYNLIYLLCLHVMLSAHA